MELQFDTVKDAKIAYELVILLELVAGYTFEGGSPDREASEHIEQQLQAIVMEYRDDPSDTDPLVLQMVLDWTDGTAGKPILSMQQDLESEITKSIRRKLN